MTLSSLGRKFGPLFLTALHLFTRGCSHLLIHSSLKVPPQNFNQVAVWTLPGPLFFSFSDILLLICCCAWDLSGCQTGGLSFVSWICGCGEEFMIDSITARCSGLVASNFCCNTSSRASAELLLTRSSINLKHLGRRRKTLGRKKNYLVWDRKTSWLVLKQTLTVYCLTGALSHPLS